MVRDAVNCPADCGRNVSVTEQMPLGTRTDGQSLICVNTPGPSEITAMFPISRSAVPLFEKLMVRVTVTPTSTEPKSTPLAESVAAGVPDGRTWVLQALMRFPTFT